MSVRSIYLAGPDVFLQDAIEVGRKKKQMCAELGFEGLFPFDNELPANVAADDRSRMIFEANVAMMRRADIIVANLTPFRGPSADVGTAFELGFMAGLGKPRLGYSNWPGDLLSTTVQTDKAARFNAETATWVDSLNMSIEDFGNEDNLMITCTLAAAGFPMVINDVPEADRFRDLAGFRQCLLLAQRLK